jgi:hypothetical protein
LLKWREFALARSDQPRLKKWRLLALVILANFNSYKSNSNDFAFFFVKDGVCQLSNQYGEGKKIISNGLAKLTCQNPKKEIRRRGREERTRE